LVNLEQEKLANEHNELLAEIIDLSGILADQARIYAIIREDCEMLIKKHGDDRRTAISDEEYGEVDLEDLIEEETMVVSISHQGYIKRTPASTYRAQRRGGKGIRGAQADEDDPVEHLFVTSTHDYLLFFTNRGKVYWQKVYNLPALSRESKGRAVVNLLNLAEGEQIADCRAVRDFTQPDHYLMMATRKGLVKKTELKAYSRPMKTGIIAIKLKEGDELVDVAIVKSGDEVILATAGGMAIRFSEADARPMGRNASGVKGVSLGKGDALVGMVVADPDATLLTACLNGYGKRTPFGPNAAPGEVPSLPEDGEPAAANGASPAQPQASSLKPQASDDEGAEGDAASSGFRYRTQNRGGKGLRDIKTTDRNGPVVSIVRVDDADELLMMTARGKIQRIKTSDVSVIGRNTQGVRIMSLDEGDSVAAVVRVPKDENEGDEQVGAAADVESQGTAET
jgi:DNA gyrase subunit A